MPNPHIGSTVESTAVTARGLKKLFSDLDVPSIIDLPCGVGDWTIYTLPKNCKYTGLDIKESIISFRNKNKNSEDQKFLQFNVLQKILPNSNLVVFRDLAIHLSNAENMIALNNIRQSRSTWLLAGTFTERTNEDLTENTFRRVNLQASPYSFPEPEVLVPDPMMVDGSPKSTDLDRMLGLWRMENVPSFCDATIKMQFGGGPQVAKQYQARAQRHLRMFSNAEQAAVILLRALKLDPNLTLDADEKDLLERHSVCGWKNTRLESP